MRAVIRSAILADATLATLGVVPEYTLSGDVDTPAGGPFLNLKWGVRTRGIGRSAPTVLVVWVHDFNTRDYGRIDAIINRLRVVLEDIVGVADTDYGGWVDQVRWDQDGPDTQDDGHRSIVRTSSYTIMGSI